MAETQAKAFLKIGEIHLWCVPLNISERCSQRLFETLTAQEKDRALRYRAPHHGRDFVVGRGLLRSILSQYLEAEPEQIAITYGRHGKPQLADSPISFNLAHSGGLMVVAVALEPTVGIDVEQIRLLPERDTVVDRFFSQTEQREFFSLPEPQRDRAFFTLWTRREAILKAGGSGWAERSEELKPELSIFNWNPKDGYAGAVAIAGKDWRLIEVPTSRLQATIDLT